MCSNVCYSHLPIVRGDVLDISTLAFCQFHASACFFMCVMLIINIQYAGIVTYIICVLNYMFD